MDEDDCVEDCVQEEEGACVEGCVESDVESPKFLSGRNLLRSDSDFIVDP